MQPQQTLGVVPLHHQIADALRARIESGELAPGDPVPTIRELSEQWNCAPGSVRSALDVLKAEGRITGGRGKAGVVRTPPRRIRLSIDQSQVQKDLVLRPRTERACQGALEITLGMPITSVHSSARYEQILASAELAQEFEVFVGASLLRRTYEMVDRATRHRLAWSVSYIPVHLIASNPDLLDETKEPWPGGHQHQLYTVGIEIDRFIRSVIATEPTPGERQRWGMESGVPLLCVRSRSIDTDGRVVELSDATYPADRTEFTITEQLSRWASDYPKYDEMRERAGEDVEA